MFYTFSSEYNWFGDVVIFVSGPFLRNFRLEGIIVCCWFYFPSNLYKICDITFKISKLLKRIRYLI